MRIKGGVFGALRARHVLAGRGGAGDVDVDVLTPTRPDRQCGWHETTAQINH